MLREQNKVEARLEAFEELYEDNLLSSEGDKVVEDKMDELRWMLMRER